MLVLAARRIKRPSRQCCLQTRQYKDKTTNSSSRPIVEKASWPLHGGVGFGRQQVMGSRSRHFNQEKFQRSHGLGTIWRQAEGRSLLSGGPEYMISSCPRATGVHQQVEVTTWEDAWNDGGTDPERMLCASMARRWALTVETRKSLGLFSCRINNDDEADNKKKTILLHRMSLAW